MAAVKLLLLLSMAALARAQPNLAQYDVVWDSLIKESKDFYTNNMPLGNGGFAANVLAGDAYNGTISVLLAHSGAWNEAGELFKPAFVDLSFKPNPFDAGLFFEMRMDVTRATVIMLLGGRSNTSYALKAEMYIDANSDLLAVDLSAASGKTYTATVTLRRVRDREFVFTAPFTCYNYNISADVVVDRTTLPTSTLMLHHRNSETTFVYDTLHGMNLMPAMEVAPDYLLNRTLVVALSAPGFVASSDSVLVGQVASNPVRITVACGIAVVADPLPLIKTTAARASKGAPPRAAHDKWWAAFWARSWITVSEPVVSRQFVLQRMIVAMQARTPFPIKFNGMLFTAQRAPNVDIRDWGGTNWWQNLRSPYYSMLTTGDGDMLLPMLENFNSHAPLARKRTLTWFNYTGLVFPEYTHPLLGTTHPDAYGCGRAGEAFPPIGYEVDTWNHYNVQGSLDMSLFALDYFSHTDDVKALRSLLPMLDDIVTYFGNRFPQRDDAGKMVIFPTQAVETWQCPNYPPDPYWCATNDAPTVSGLHSVLPRLLRLPESVTSPEQRERWAALLAVLPDLPQGVDGNTTVLKPCHKCPPQTSNVENPEMYSTHPYRLFGVGRDNIQLARDTFAHIMFPSDEGWNQVCMDAALLGLAARAQALVTVRAHTAPAPMYRFPVFMPHLQDFEPSADHLGIFTGALAYMLVQELDDQNTVILLPAWPCSWDVNFRIHVLHNTVVEGSLVKGHLNYTATPTTATHIVAHDCQQVSAEEAEQLRAEAVANNLAARSRKGRVCKAGLCLKH